MNDSNAGELIFRRVHNASPEVLFDCMTQPEHLAHFWGPTGTSTPVENFVVDLRPGGAFETAMVNDATGDIYVMKARYVEIDRPHKLVWTEPDVEGGMTTTITFNYLGDGQTEVITHQTNVPELFRSPPAQKGFLTSLDRFDTYIKQLLNEEDK